ncbi:Melanoma-associated antigen 10 [Lemmus lemmus]
MLSIFQNARSFFPSSTLGGALDETSSNDESSDAGQSSEDPEALLDIVIQEKATDLVFLFIYKYRMKEPITLSEIHEVITKDYENHFPVIFMEASKCLEMTFGIDVKQSDLLSSAYVFVNSLNLTYEDTLSDNDIFPRNAFLIVILGVIFIEGNCASEERIWEFLKLVGVHDGEEHFICGDPREFLTVHLVQQNYLEYRQVPNSQPACFEFLWGPRAHAETTKMKVLEFLAKMNGCDPDDFSIWYEEALRDEEERAWAANDTEDGSPTMWLAER